MGDVTQYLPGPKFMGLSEGKKGGGLTPAGKLAGQFSGMLSKMSGPTRKLYFGQMKEAFQTGSIGARTPIIQQAVEQGLHEGSRAQTITTEGVAKLGGNAARSPAATDALAEQRAMAERAVAGIPSEMVGRVALSAPKEVTAASNVAMSMLGSAGIAQNQAAAAAAQQNANTNSEIGAGVGIAVAIVAAI